MSRHSLTRVRLCALAFIVLLLSGSTGDCGRPRFVSICAGIESKAKAYNRDLDGWHGSGDIAQPEYERAREALRILEAEGRHFTLYGNWDAMDSAGRLKTVREAIRILDAELQQLATVQVGARRQQDFEAWLSNLRRGIAGLRELEAESVAR